MTLRIATWNLFLGKDLKGILKSIKSNKDFEDIDLIALQEASIHDGVEDAKVITEVLGKKYKYYQVTAQNIKGLVQANAVIWNSKRVKISKKDTFFLPTHEEVLLGRFEKTIKKMLPAEHRNSVIIEGNIEDKTFRMYSVHFDVIGFSHKKEQLQKVMQHDKRMKKADFVCIAGDMNTFKILKRPKWLALTDMAEKYKFLDITTTIKWTFSKKAFLYRQKTDAIFLKNKKGMEFSSWSSNIAGSDHIPIFAIIEI